jgi:limonene 1,2-monooxygenase
MTAGRHGVGVLSLGAGMPGGKAALPANWAIAEEHAAKNGVTVDRSQWRLVIGGYVAESMDEAIRDVKEGRYRETTEYFEQTLGRPHSEIPIEKIIENDGALIGDPDSVAAQIDRLQEASGGCGGLLFVANEWAPREKILRSYELFARYVMPRFQNMLPPVQASQQFVSSNRRAIFAPSLTAIANAFAEAGKELPAELIARGAHRAQ